MDIEANFQLYMSTIYIMTKIKLCINISQNEFDIYVPLKKTFLSIYYNYISLRLMYEKSMSECWIIFVFSKKLRAMSVFLPYGSTSS